MFWMERLVQVVLMRNYMQKGKITKHKRVDSGIDSSFHCKILNH